MQPKFQNVAYLEDVHNLYFSSNFDMFDTVFLWIDCFFIFNYIPYLTFTAYVVQSAYVFKDERGSMGLKGSNPRNSKMRQMPKLQCVQQNYCF